MSNTDFMFKFTIENLETKQNTDLKFPITPEEMTETLNRIGLREDSNRSTYRLIDFYTPFAEFADIEGACYTSNERGETEYDNSINELNYLGNALYAMAYGDRQNFAAATEAGLKNENIHEMINLAQNMSCFNLVEDVATYYDLVERRLSNMGIDTENLGFLMNYVDFDRCGEDLKTSDKGHFVVGGYLETQNDIFREIYNGDIYTSPEEYRVVPFESEIGFEDIMLESSMDLAMDIDSFLDKYNEEYSKKHLDDVVPQHLSDALLENNLEEIKKMLANTGRPEADNLLSRVTDFEKTFLQRVPQKETRSAEKATIIVKKESIKRFIHKQKNNSLRNHSKSTHKKKQGPEL